MPDIRVDPHSLRQAAAKLGEAAEETGSLGEEAAEAAAGAPSYDGQFGSQVQSLGAEAHAQMTAVATKLSALSEALLLKTEEFEAADSETQAGLQGLLAQLRGWIDSMGQLKAPAWLFPSPLFAWLFQEGEPPPEEPEPWYGGLVLELSKAWDWYHQNVNQRIYDSVDTWQGIGENGRRITLYYLAQLWFEYDKAVNLPIYDSVETWRGNANSARTIVLYGLARAWFGYDKTINEPIYGVVDAVRNLHRVQGPGADSDGPIAEYLDKFSAADASGNLISPVGSEIAGLIENRQDGITITFVDFNAGIVPWRGYVVLPPNFADGGQVGAPGNVGLVAHELTHVLERELNDPMYWPSGAPLSFGGARLVGDSTNYMEVLSNIIGKTVEYDLLSEANPTSARLDVIERELATYTDADALNAVRYLVKSENGVEVYRDNYVHELGISDHRIPAGGWDHWLKTMGFTDTAIQHIRDIASQGTAVHVDQAELDQNTGLVVTATSTPTAQPTATPPPTLTPTPTSTPAPTATSTASPSASSSPTPTPGKPTP